MPSTAQVFHDVSFHGSESSLNLPNGQRYDLKHFLDLAPALVHAISSASLSRSDSDGEESSLYLFRGSTDIPSSDYRRFIPYFLVNMRAQIPFIQDFHGDFLRLTLPGGRVGAYAVSDLAADSFKNVATSLMFVNRWRTGKKEFTLSASDTLTAGWDLAMIGLLPLVQVFMGGGVGISQYGNPVFTWLPFPAPSQRNLGLSDNETYMVASQQFVFSVWGVGVNVWLVFYLHLGPNSDGNLELNVRDMDQYVWPGSFQGPMISAIDRGKPAIISALSGFSKLILNTLSHTPCSDVYLLPGTQSDVRYAGNGNAGQGNAFNDVTIVIESPN